MLKKSLWLIFLFSLTTGLYSSWNNLNKLHVAVLNISSRLSNEALDPASVAELLQSCFVEKAEFIVVERLVLNKLIDEQKLELSGLSDTEASKLGKLAQADKVLAGSVSKVGGKYYLIIRSVDVATGVVDLTDQIIANTLKGLTDSIPDLAERIIQKAKGEKIPAFIIKDQPASVQMDAKETPDTNVQADHSLFGYYLFCGNAKDYSASHNDAMVIGPKPAENRFNQSNFAYLFGSNICYIAASKPVSNIRALTLIAWFKTDTRSGGHIAGFGDEKKGMASQYDKMIYMNDDGEVYFGLRTKDDKKIVLSTELTYNDNEWHMAAASFSPKGAKLIVDGQLSASNTGAIEPANYPAYLRLGYEILAGWPGEPSLYSFQGSIDDIMIFNQELGLDQIVKIYHNNGWRKE